jgi:outer membrane protein assembly factor BamB
MQLNRPPVALLAWLVLTASALADWPQWRGPNRDAKVTDFKVPATWPKELTKKWSVTVGDGVATPALVGDKLYVFTREGASEVVRCLDAATGNEIWKQAYEEKPVTGPAAQFPGPRSSPTVASGKVVVLSVQGRLTCLDAATGKELWHKEGFGRPPRFSTSCSPLIVDNFCVVQLGGESAGAIVALDLATGDEKWQWAGDGTAYASPIISDVAGTREIVARTSKNIVGLNVADGKLLWQTPFEEQGRGGYNSASPIVERDTLIYAGKGLGTKAASIEKQGSALAAKELWSSADNSVQYNTPVLKNGLIFGISDTNSLFCINAATGQTAWSISLPRGRVVGYGSVVDAGNVLLVLNPSAQLLVFEPSDKEAKQLASYKVSESETFAYPVASGNRIYIKDKDKITLWTID